MSSKNIRIIKDTNKKEIYCEWCPALEKDCNCKAEKAKKDRGKK